MRPALMAIVAALFLVVGAGCGGSSGEGTAPAAEQDAANEPLPLPERTTPSLEEVVQQLGLREPDDDMERIAEGEPPEGYEIRGDEPYFPGGAYYDPESDCQIDQVLLGADQIAMYAEDGTGRVIATNPSQTVGIELAVDRDTYPEAAERCHAALTEALQKFE